jgi:signal transduction histidine kinase
MARGKRERLDQGRGAMSEQYNREEERWRESDRRRRIAEGLRDVLTALNSDQTLESILDLIAAQARHLLDTQAVGIYRLESGVDGWTVEAARGLLVTYVAGFNVPIGQDTLRQAIVSRRPVVGQRPKTVSPEEETVPQGQADLPAAESWPRWYRAWLAVPIVTKGEVYGGMLLYYSEPRALSEEEIQLAISFCDQAALAIENARLRERVEHAATTAERERLARDLHDSVTQTLFSASVIAEAMPRIWLDYPEERERGIEELQHLTRGALAEMRTLLVELRPTALTEKPLGEVLGHLTAAVSGQTRTPVRLRVEGETRLRPEMQVALYRIAQEALNNMAKHAGASQAWVALGCGAASGQLEILDDGRGFDVEAAAAVPGRLGLGIMRERAQAIGADFAVESLPGRGTRVCVRWQN